MYSIEDLIEIVNNGVNNIKYNSEPEKLYEPIKYILSIGGKRIRPVLMLMGYNLWKDDVSQIMNNAIALETYHNFTLLHDDLMDNSDMRRGNPTVHKKWDANTAILSGDTMLILAYKLFNKGQYNPDAWKSFIDATLGVCEGQQYDMDFEDQDDVTEAQYMEMIRLKTSLLLGYALKIGAQLAEADDEDAQNLYEFGEKMGLAFQLQDDYLDVYGDPKLFKKNLGGDIVENKKTFLLINALRKASGKEKDILNEWLNKKGEYEKAEKISAVTDIYNHLSIKELTLQKIEDLINLSIESLNKVKVNDTKKAELRRFATKLLGRKY